MKNNKERVKLIGEKTMKNKINGIKYIIPIPIKIALSFLSILNVICMLIPSMYNGSHFKNSPQPLNFFTYIYCLKGAFYGYAIGLLTIALIFTFILCIWLNTHPIASLCLIAQFICTQIVFRVNSAGKAYYYIDNGHIIVIVVFCAIVLTFIISLIITSKMKIQKKTPVKKAEPSVADELLKYKNLLDAGAITQEEYEEKKQELL